MKFFDTHCHLNLKPLADQFETIVAQAASQQCYVNIVGIDYQSSLLAVEQAQKSPYLYCTIGIHPTEAKAIVNDQAILEHFEQLLQSKQANKIIAIGETGFDFFYSEPQNYDAEYSIQKKWFQHQINLAIKHDLPLMLHVRDGHQECLQVLKQIHHYGIIHCFNQNFQLAEQYLNLPGEWMIAIPGIITYKKADELSAAVAQISLNKLLVETDAPWLAPVPFRGKTNYPYYCMENIKKIASLKNIELQTCAEQIFKNSLQIFKLSPK